ncbi:MAG TPA: MFS transporter [Hyphomicrobiaceae bacterium]|jgi:predicted MFS family arabinose efflux permease|nr:MFS transporter [Hyphomicrobiaceae bacterium]
MRPTHPLVIFAAGFLILFVGGGARFAIGLTLKPMVEELGWVRGEVGLAVFAYLVVSAVATYLAGRLADRAGPRLLLNAGVAMSGLGIGLMCLVAEPWHAVLFYGVVFAVGNGMASLTPVGVMVTRAFPGRAGFANSAVISGMCLGQLVMIAALAALLARIGWRSVFVWLGVAHLVLIPFLLMALPRRIERGGPVAANGGLGVREAARTRAFWLLLAVYAICGFDDFFVATHVVAFAQDRGVDGMLAGNLLAFMGLTGLLGLLATGLVSDRAGPVWTSAFAFAARVAVFGLIAVDQSTVSIAVFALVFGATFMVTAPMTVLFVRDHFGMKHLGALTGLITMVHQIFGGIGAWGGALIFDATGSYDAAFVLALAVSALALTLTLGLRRTA